MEQCRLSIAITGIKQNRFAIAQWSLENVNRRRQEKPTLYREELALRSELEWQTP
jgi:hypothetical protein